MAFNGSGTFTRLYNWVSDALAGIGISAPRMDAEMDGFASALSNCVTRDGQGYFQTDVNANGNRLKNLVAGTAALPAVFAAGSNNAGLYYPAAGAVGLSSGGGTGTLQLANAGALSYNTSPSAWVTGYDAIELKYTALGSASNLTDLAQNCYNGASGWVYKAAAAASIYRQQAGSHYWFSAAAGSAGGSVSFPQPAMTLDSAGNLIVGSATGSSHYLKKTGAAEGALLLAVDNGTAASLAVYAVTVNGFNASSAALLLGKNNSTGRSINAGGTINASGADYAEYERNNGLAIPKGAIVGFKADGTLTLTWAEAVRFGIKSTSPALVGGDTWAPQELVGGPPDAPGETATDEELQAYAEARQAWQAKVDALRAQVDRVAYSGKVPVNVLSAAPGDYILATAAPDGSIRGTPVSAPTFEQYRAAVGRVNRLLPDGRAEVAVLVH